jgi:hypothetical protein
MGAALIDGEYAELVSSKFPPAQLLQFRLASAILEKLADVAELADAPDLGSGSHKE